MPPVKKAKTAPKAQKDVGEDAAEAVVSGQLQKKIIRKNQKLANKRGIVFIKHLPHGFFEEQLKKYFQQFGNVTRLRLARSTRTGGSKCFAFVEFEYPEVAQVAAETMDNYLMFKKVVKAAYISPEQQRFNYFKTSLRKVKNKAGKDIYVSGKTASAQRNIKKQNNWSDDAFQKRTASQLKKLNKLKQKCEHLGIDFSKIIVEPTKVTTEDTADNDAEEMSEAAGGSKQKIQKEKSQLKVSHKNAESQIPLKKAKKNVKTNQINLEDLLGNTINDDSEDEDYIAVSNDEYETETSSDEETYGFSKDDSDPEEEDEGTETETEEEDLVVKEKLNKKTKSSFGKSIKPPKVNRLDELIKRKPHLGGIQKTNKKVNKISAIPKAKNKLQLKAAQEIAKALPLIKKKPAVKTKAGKKK